MRSWGHMTLASTSSTLPGPSTSDATFNTLAADSPTGESAVEGRPQRMADKGALVHLSPLLGQARVAPRTRPTEGAQGHEPHRTMGAPLDPARGAEPCALSASSPRPDAPVAAGSVRSEGGPLTGPVTTAPDPLDQVPASEVRLLWAAAR